MSYLAVFCQRLHDDELQEVIQRFQSTFKCDIYSSLSEFLSMLKLENVPKYYTFI